MSGYGKGDGFINYTNRLIKFCSCYVWNGCSDFARIVSGALELNINFGVLLLGLIVAGVLFLFKKLQSQIGSILCYSYFLFVMLDTISSKSLDLFLGFIVINVCLIALYLNKRFLLVYAIILDIFAVSLVFLLPKELMEKIVSDTVTVNICIIILYFLVKCMD